ncbi:unnamed protein product, partial [Musa hybrid cultivar]
LLLLLASATIQTRGQRVETFTYVNEGEFGPYITEYDASYRVLPIASSPFQFAFYNTTPDAFYLALRMGTLRSESILRWVWEANRGRPVRENATFSLLPSGNLVLAEADGRVVWTTNTANKGVVGLKVLPNGNVSLRLRGPNKLVSRKSAVDGSFGIYSLVFGPGGITMYINSVASKPLAYYNYSDGLLSFSGPGDSVTFVCEPETEDNFAWECKLIINLSRPKYNATLSFLRLDIDGNLAVYTYYDPVDYRAWEKTFAFFSDEKGWLNGCGLTSKCGAFGVCEDEMCVACPSKDGLLGWSTSCATPSLAACKEGVTPKYYKVEGVENFLSTYSDGEGAQKLEECKRRCSMDCKCQGFLYWEKDSRCWLAPLLGTLSKVSNSSHVAYVKYLKEREDSTSRRSREDRSAMPVFKTPFSGYAVRFSPFYEGRLLVATSQNFGILGNGRLHVLDLLPSPGAPGISEVAAFDTADGVYDCCWSESHDSLAVSAVADGSLKLWDASLPPSANPVRSFREHSREAHSVDWNPVRRDSFLSASWDDSLKLWTLDRPASLRTFREHSYCVYSVSWSPRHADVFASASGDRTVRVWDVREPVSTLVIPAHDHEILSCDWNKYDECCLATASVDKTIRVWDIRATRAPLANLAGHGYAVRRIRFSPHRESVLLSCSYDMTVCMWDYRAEDALIARYDHHTEFAVGIDMSVLVEGLIASTGWDEVVYVWQHGTDPRA